MTTVIMTTQVAPETSLLFGQVTLFISNLTSFKNLPILLGILYLAPLG